MAPRLTLVAARQTPQRVARSTVIVMGATLASTMLGFVREVVNARYFGASGDMDAFLAAAVVPTILFGVFNGALVSALVPIFSDYLATDREDDAWRLASTLVITLAVGLSIAAAVGALLAPWYIPGIARFHDRRLDEAILMARWLMPTIVATSLAGIVASLLNAYLRFTAAALQGFIANIFTVLVVVFTFHRYGIGALVIFVVASHGGRIVRLGAQLGFVGLLLGAGGGILVAFHPWRLTGMGLMLAGTFVAFFGYLIPLLEQIQREDLE